MMRAHPLNTDFGWRSAPTTPSTLAPGQVADCDRDGFCLITVHLVARDETCRAFTRHPSLLGIAADLIGPDVRLYWDQAVYKNTGRYGLTCFDAVPDGERDAVPVEARVGSAVLFSSLTPHRTGPNLSASVRKAYIVQYAPSGAAVQRDGVVVVADAPDRQYEVLSGGVPV
jgi:hypothetical protein